MTVVLSSCAGNFKQDYQPSKAATFGNQKVVPKNYSRVWDEYVRELSKDFFVINNISKESRIINVSFSSNNPKQFVDCGKTKWSATHLSIGTRSGEYEVANSSSRFAVIRNILVRVDRKTRLNGRANIYIAPSRGGTLIRVNIKYALTVRVTITAPNGQTRSDQAIVDFSTSTPSQRDQNSPQCSTNGALEMRLLGLVK